MIQSKTHTTPIPIDISRKHNMSPPSLSQGLQSCLEPLLLEPRVLMQQLTPPNPLLSLPWPHKILDTSTTLAAEKPYVHPFSNSFLSAKSLEMCTESLCSESGSGIDEFPHLTTEGHRGQSPQPQRAAAKPINKVKRGAGESSFPPPLTSISGSGGVQVQTHREGGRLVIKAFTVSSSSSCRFQAERGNGRLRLSLLIDCGGGGGDEEEEEVDRENVDGGDGFGGHISAEWSSSRCNCDMSKHKKAAEFAILRCRHFLIIIWN